MKDSNHINEVTALSCGIKSTGIINSNELRDYDWIKKNIPCQHACPAGTDIPGYLEAIYTGKYDEAYKINLRDNIFPGVLGRVCSKPCESECRHGWSGNGSSVAICNSKRSTSDFSNKDPVILPDLFSHSNKRVAVIGSGVAGLSVSRELSRYGHDVDIYEKHCAPGGMLIQGIPEFRLPRNVIKKEIDQILYAGVSIYCNKSIGIDLSLEGLVEEYDAVVIAAGTMKPNIPDIPGVHLNNIEHGLKYLLEVNEYKRTTSGTKTIVIGGGFTAMDCARTAIRLGADATIIYRRSIEDMVVPIDEINDSKEEGVEILSNLSPDEFTGNVDGVEYAKFTQTKTIKQSGIDKDILKFLNDNKFDLETNNVILATGQIQDLDWVEDIYKHDISKNIVNSSHEFACENEEKLFLAGDFALGATSLISAIAHAKQCARSVDEWLMSEKRIKKAVKIYPYFQSKTNIQKTTGRNSSMNYLPRNELSKIPVDIRSLLSEVENGYSESTAMNESSRCYFCHYKFEIINEKCVLCDECIKVKPKDNCIVEISKIIQGESGVIERYQLIEEGNTDSLYYNKLWIDQSNCIRCGQCESVCPVNAITIQKVNLYEYA